jgi:hypothetical protein
MKCARTTAQPGLAPLIPACLFYNRLPRPVCRGIAGAIREQGRPFTMTADLRMTGAGLPESPRKVNAVEKSITLAQAMPR